MSIINQRLTDEVYVDIRLEDYSIHAEKSHGGWIKRFVHFDGMKSRDDRLLVTGCSIEKHSSLFMRDRYFSIQLSIYPC